MKLHGVSFLREEYVSLYSGLSRMWLGELTNFAFLQSCKRETIPELTNILVIILHRNSLDFLMISVNHNLNVFS